MHLTNTVRDVVRKRWLQNGRTPPRPPYRFSEVKPLKIRDHVTTGTRKLNDVVCIPQMMEMLSCFKTNEFDQTKCSKQITSFQQCYGQYLETRGEKKSQEISREPIPGQTLMTKAQLNKLLKRYPQTPPTPGVPDGY